MFQRSRSVQTIGVMAPSITPYTAFADGRGYVIMSSSLTTTWPTEYDPYVRSTFYFWNVYVRILTYAILAHVSYTWSVRCHLS